MPICWTYFRGNSRNIDSNYRKKGQNWHENRNSINSILCCFDTRREGTPILPMALLSDAKLHIPTNTQKTRT